MKVIGALGRMEGVEMEKSRWLGIYLGQRTGRAQHPWDASREVYREGSRMSSGF